MSTRKLILWSLVCGVLILVAGSVKLFQSAESVDVTAELLDRGQETEIAGMTVSVESVEVTADRTLVTVTIGGVEGVDATEGWKLLAGGEASEPVSGTGDGQWCTTTTVQVQRCVVAFPLSSGTPAVFYYREGDNRQWAIEE